MNLRRFFLGRTAKIVAGRARPGLEMLEDRNLPSTLPFPVVEIANAEYTQDSSLTRNDVIHLLDYVAGTETAVIADGVVSFQPVSDPDLSAPLSASPITELQNIFQNSAQWGMAPDVANLAEKVVGFNQANEHYQGTVLLATGQLAAGDQAGNLSDLVDKWFYGDDLPAIASGDHYQKAAGTLFGANGPRASDVAQGRVGDCYFLSNLSEAALQDPQVIENMFINDGDGIYTVRFYDYNAATKTSTPDYLTVNSELPVNSKGEFIYANQMYDGHQTNVDNANNVLWVALAEKAYAQLAEEGWSRPANDSANSYASLAVGNNRPAGQQITGSSTAIWVNPASAAFAADFQNGDLLTICTYDQPMTDAKLGRNHVYAVKAVDLQNDTITLMNPYTTRDARTVTVSLEVLAENAGDAAVVGQ